MAASENSNIVADSRCAKSVRIRSYSGPYAVRMQENTDENNSEYGHFFRSEWMFCKNCKKKKKKLDLGILTAKGIDIPEKWALKKKICLFTTNKTKDNKTF